ncbi:MAG: prolyl aminopeptidase [Gammaproteobacteria bacterium]|nr:MAG: prolyl aminopeptidase [Gammaproteobacteria bacterium]
MKRTLYPELIPWNQFHLDVGDGHALHVEQSGHHDGIPAVYLHGGPGAGSEPWHRQLFDPARYHIVQFDQRGAGKSRPHASVEHNTTADLVADMERIRTHLGIERWLVVGGSWGSTLALAYAEAHPERVTGLILRGIFLCRDEDIHWFYQSGAHRIFPDYWQDFIAPIPEDERDDLVAAYHRRLFSDDEVTRMRAAEAWSVWEGRCATLRGSKAVIDHFADPFVALSLARIECHYFVNHAFLEPGQLLNDAHRLRDIPGTIIHGRYDIVCPADQAHALHRAWPEAELKIIPDAGHAASEPGILEALLEATDAFAERLGSP